MNGETLTPKTIAIRTALLAVGVGGLAYALGLSLVLALLIAATIATIGALIPLFDPIRDAAWSVSAVTLRKGARREISRLSWSMSTGTRGVSASAGSRLHDIAAHRLALRGIDLDDPADQDAAEDALGRVAYRVLSTPSITTADALLAVVRALDHLDATPDPGRSPRAAPLAERSS
ncbi:hypothetical protein [Planctomonas psychrotolerans]|uniref:hypothetical protein n=1 Tax=Planctomonas psychrotolerans TaxID=2528712 RepID=UPI00123A01A5|nr:hypothetical protein [Planctomonas psychrotolerans]